MEIGGLSNEKDLMLFEKFVRQASCHNVLEQNFNPIFELLMVNNMKIFQISCALMFTLLKSDCKWYLECKEFKFITAAKPNQISSWVDATICSLYWSTFEIQNS